MSTSGPSFPNRAEAIMDSVKVPTTSSPDHAEADINTTTVPATSISDFSTENSAETATDNSTTPATTTSEKDRAEAATVDATATIPPTQQELAEDRKYQKGLEIKWSDKKLSVKVGGSLVRNKRKDGEDAKRAQEAIDHVQGVLEDFGRVRMIKPTLVKTTNLRNVLEAWKAPDNGASDAMRGEAGALFSKFEAQGWGIRPATNTSTTNSTNNVRARADARPRPRPRPRGNNQNDTVGTTAPLITPQSALQRQELHLIDQNNMVWGTYGIMRDFRFMQSSTGNSISVPADKRLAANVFGHNGIAVGECWYNRWAMVRDGASGEHMDGIYGTPEDGAFAVVTTSSVYEDLEMEFDDGVTVHYAGSGAANKDKTEDVTKGSMALRKSIETGKPVRVIRGPLKKVSYAPKAGYRYDGLYKVTKELVRRQKGKEYKVFVMKREAGQPAMVTDKPGPGLLAVYAQIKEEKSKATGWTV